MKYALNASPRPLLNFPDPFLILLNKAKQPLQARNSFENKIF